MSFWETCFGSNKSLRAAVECNPALWNHLVLVEPTLFFFFFGFQADIPHYLFRPALRAHPLLENAGYKTEGWGETEAWMLPSCPLPPTSPVSPSMPLFEEEEREVIHPPLPLLMISFSFFSPGHRGGLLPEWADVGQSHTAKLHSSWGENLLWIKPRPQSGLVLILLLCAQSNWRGPDYRRYLWRLTAIWSQHSDTTFGGNWVYLDYKLRLDCTKAEFLLAIMSNFTLNQHVMFETCLCSSKAQRPNYSGPWKWLLDCVY